MFVRNHMKMMSRLGLIVLSFLLLTSTAHAKAVILGMEIQPEAVTQEVLVEMYKVKTIEELNVRATPNGTILGVLAPWSIVSVYGTSLYNGATWYKIKFGIRTGYIHSYYTTTNLLLNSFASSVSVDRMVSMVGVLAKTDNARIAGTQSEKSAGDYLTTSLTSLGYTTQRQWFPTWIRLADGTRGADSTSSNVFATYNYDANKKTVLLMAHYDSVYTYGADDNASGVAMVVELARYLKTRVLDVNVAILLTGAEEGRHHGSLYYADHPLIPLSSLALVINCDMVGAGTTYEIYNYLTTMQQGYYSKYALNIGKQFKLNTVQTLSSWSDHTSFEQKNVPTITFMNLKSYPYYHTDNDTVSRMNKTVLRNISNIILNVIEEVDRKY